MEEGGPRRWCQLRSGGICIVPSAALHWAGSLDDSGRPPGASVLPSAPKSKSGPTSPTHFSQVEG